MQPHYAASEQRISELAEGAVVLVAQDTTSLNYTGLPATVGLGPIGTTVDGAQGLHLHSSLAVTAQGVPLGFLDAQCWVRDREAFGKKAQRHELPIEQKESYRWIKSYQAVAAVQKRNLHLKLVSVGDREADIYELFAEAARDPAGPKLLVRAKHNRKVQDESARLFETIQAQPIAGYQSVHIARHKNRPAREAELAIRFAALTLCAPPDKTQRWNIEVFHRTLKSGCRIEERQLGDADRLEACLAIDMVVAWRIFYLVKLGREVPDVPCDAFYDTDEWQVLVANHNSKHSAKNQLPSDQPPSLREANRMVAKLGGFMARNSDGEPGTETMWRGLQRLDGMTEGWRLASGP